MRAILQRVTGATVHVDGRLVSRIGPGIVALIGIGIDDSAAEIEPLSKKILSSKLWNEGLKAQDMVVPPQYRPEGQSGQEQEEQQQVTAGHLAESRKEQVWGGKPWKTSVVELGGEVLCISQFTLHARLTKGTKPDFHRSMGGDSAKEIYTKLLEHLGKNYRRDRIKDGAFGEMMQCSLTNDGPVTIIIDTSEKKS